MTDNATITTPETATPSLMDERSLPVEDDTQIVVTLSQPLIRGDGKEIREVTVLEPNSAELSKAGGRTALYQMDDAAHAKLLARITQPQVTPQMFGRLRPKDSQKLMNAVLSFLAGSSSEDVFVDLMTKPRTSTTPGP